MIKKNYIYLLIILLVCYFFSFTMIYTYDSFHYLSYVDIIIGNVPFSSWDIIRGPSFPLIVSLFTFLFGHNIMSHLIFGFLFFLVTIFFTYKIFNNVFSNNKHKYLVYLLTAICMFNPLIFGYYHVMLTEFLSITLTIVMCFLSFVWLKQDLVNHKFITIIILFSLIVSFLWFLKQPYIILGIIPVISSAILSIADKPTLKNIFSRLVAMLSVIIFLVISIVCWNTLLKNNNVEIKSYKSSGNLIVNNILALPSYELIDDMNVDNYKNFIKDEDISIIKNKKYVLLLTKNKHKKIIDKDYIKLADNQIPVKKAIIISILNVFQNPKVIIKDYMKNYCAEIGICVIKSDDNVQYYITNDYNMSDFFENRIIAYRIYNEEVKNNSFPVPEFFLNNYSKYSVNFEPGIINKIESVFILPTNIFYKVLLLISPLSMLISIIIYFIARKKSLEIKEKSQLSLILVSTSLLYLMANAYVGAIIDRYSVQAFIPLIINLVLIIVLNYDIITLRKKQKK